MALRPKHQRFVEEYLVDLNATQAALRAGYSPKSARIIGQQLLAKIYIAAAIAEAKDARSHQVDLTQRGVLAEIALLAHSDVLHYTINDHGDVQLRAGAPAQAMRAVASLKKKIRHTKHGITYETEITLWNKPASLRMGGEHLGLFHAAESKPPDIHVHVHHARERLTTRVRHLAQRHAEDAANGR